MKPKTLKKIRYIKRLMDGPHKAFFWIEKTDGQLYYTYPKGGWIKEDKTLTEDEDVERTIKLLETTPREIKMGRMDFR
jgi:hypothetical protein